MRVALFFVVSVISSLNANGALFLSLDELNRSTAFASDARFDPVGSVIHTSDGAYASGVLISPEWVLTAGHVADHSSPFNFNLGNDRSAPSLSRTVTDVVIHPGWPIGSSGPLGYPDLALLRLSSPIFDIAPATRYRGDDVNPLFDNQTRQYYMAGFGRYGVANETLQQDSLKRAGSNLLEYVRTVNYDVKSNTSVGRQPLVDLEWKGTPGDSGGGWFQEVDGDYYLAGITSYGGSIPFESPDFTGAVAVNQFNDWIDTVTRPTAVPEPSSFALFFTIGSVALIRYRRRGRENTALDPNCG